jgi:hypothetical protein
MLYCIYDVCGRYINTDNWKILDNSEAKAGIKRLHNGILFNDVI